MRNRSSGALGDDLGLGEEEVGQPGGSIQRVGGMWVTTL